MSEKKRFFRLEYIDKKYITAKDMSKAIRLPVWFVKFMLSTPFNEFKIKIINNEKHYYL